jgi:chromosome segregation ATPase
MDWVVWLLAGAVGVAIGILAALLIDGQFLGKRIQTAVSEKMQLQQQFHATKKSLKSTQHKLVTAQSDIRSVQESVTQTKEEVVRRTEEVSRLQHELNNAHAEIGMMHGNLNRVTEHADLVQAELQELQEALGTAVANNEALEEEIAQKEREKTAIKNEAEVAYQELAVNEVEIRHLQEKLTAVQEIATQVKQLESEKQRLCARLEASEARVQELRLQMENALQHLTETQSIRNKLVGAEEKLNLADTHIASLNKKLHNLQSQLAYSGKNQLQLIRGIGPTYARRLSEMGIFTFNDLARQAPERLAEIVKLRPWQNHDPERWIAEAQQLNDTNS